MLPILLALILDVNSTDSSILPVSAKIVDRAHEDDVITFGNVLVTFNDGHREKWTKTGHALIPRVSSNGLVGWASFKTMAYKGRPIDDTLRICWPDGHHRDIESGIYIEAWSFSDRDRSVVIKSRGPHGPAEYRKFDTTTGAILGSARGQVGRDLPLWAQPFSD